LIYQEYRSDHKNQQTNATAQGLQVPHSTLILPGTFPDAEIDVVLKFAIVIIMPLAAKSKPTHRQIQSIFPGKTLEKI